MSQATQGARGAEAADQGGRRHAAPAPATVP